MTPLPADAIKTIAVIGLGAIGASWSAWFLARGYRVQATDPDPARANATEQFVRRAWPALTEIGQAQGASADDALTRFAFHADVEACVAGADFVQENAPERRDLKIDLLARIDAALPADRIIASSTSGFGVSTLAAGMAHPERLVIGHPFNPPHLIPLVEVVGGGATSSEAIKAALAFYERAGKKAVHVRKEVAGHLANRLQAALWREAVHLVADGAASVSDIDAVIAYGPGLRWAQMGPHLIFHLAGGEGGMRHFIDHLGPPIQSWWDTLGAPRLTPEIAAALIDGVDEEIGDRSYADLVRERDARLIKTLKALT